MRALLVMEPKRRLAATDVLRRRNTGIEFVEASDLGTARQLLCNHQEFDLVMVDITLPDGTWCAMLRDLRDLAINTRFLVCAERQDQVLCADVIVRGGYYAVAPPHGWRPLDSALVPVRKSHEPSSAARSARSTAHSAVA